MVTIIIVLLLAIILFSLEIVLPGGVLGVLGGVLMLAGVYLTYDAYGGIPAVLVLVGCMIFAMASFILEFKVLPKTTFGKEMFLSGTVSGGSNVSERDASIVGAIGVVLSRMTPSGTVRVNGKRYEARSRSGFIEAGTTIEVVDHDAFRLLVQKKEE